MYRTEHFHFIWIADNLIPNCQQNTNSNLRDWPFVLLLTNILRIHAFLKGVCRGCILCQCPSF
jgi:hypothetical protein